MFLFEKIIIKKLAHVAKNDLNHAHTKTEPVTAGVDATVYCTVTAPAVTVVQFLWFLSYRRFRLQYVWESADK